LGRIDLRLGQQDSALANLQSAAVLSRQNPIAVPESTKSDLFATLGTAYRSNNQLDEAINAFGSAARSAKQSGDTTLYAQTLQQYAATLLDAGKTERAMKALQALQTLR
jgi:tetratricopeptide (TPR) repeat protein